MGNRAVIKFLGDESASGVEVYLHWNGGAESVLAFLHTMEERSWARIDYAPARFASVVCEFFDARGEDSGMSVGVYAAGTMDAEFCDNGLYEVSGVSTTGRFNVKQRGKAISAAKLSAEDRKKMEEIISELSKLRSIRKAAA